MSRSTSHVSPFGGRLFRDTIGVRVFGLFDVEHMSASQSFNAVLGSVTFPALAAAQTS